MGKFPIFSELTEAQEDLLDKGYAYGSLATVCIFSSLKKKRGEWKVKGALKQEKPDQTATFVSGALKLRKKNTWARIKLTNELRTKLKAKFVPGAAKKAKIYGELDVDKNAGTFEGEVGFVYRGKNGTSLLALMNGPIIEGKATIGKKNYGFGLEGIASSIAGRFTSYNAALWWKNKHSTLVAKHLSNNQDTYEWGDFVLSYFYKAGKSSKFGGAVTTNWKSKLTKIEFGGIYKDKDDVRYQGKIDLDGNVGLSFAKKLKKLGLLTVSTQINPKEVSEKSRTDSKIGFRLDFKK